MSKTTEQRFWEKVDKSGDCWLWTAAINGHGYGQFRFGPKHRVMDAHRVSYILEHGQPPAGLDVCHQCDNPRCVNPKHLFLGTRKENICDSVRKGRHGKRLTPAQVHEIRALRASGMTGSEIAHHFGVSRSSISSITTGKAWSALDERSSAPMAPNELSPFQANQVRFLKSIGISIKRLAELYKVSESTIFRT